jgi:predicted ATP-dependent endonuclease of OLD family
MRILELKIMSDYRNLMDIDLKFDKQFNTNVIIGNNGSGKSNILEAISSVFMNLYSGKPNFEFSFYLRYEIDGNTICIRYLKDKESPIYIYKVNDKEVASIEQYLPSRVVCNYSGEDIRIYEEYYKISYETYISNVIHNEAYPQLKMIFVGRNLWNIILLVMLVFKDDEGYKDFKKLLEDIMGIRNISKIILRPNDQILKTWVNENAISVYFNTLMDHCQEDGKIELKYFNENSVFTPMSLFLTLMGCQSAIEELSIFYNRDVNANFLSEGEKKFMVIQFILEALSDERTLVLMDEPDSHIHVSRKQELCDIFNSIDNRDNIITSHSPTLTAKFDEKSIVMLDSNISGLSKVINENKKEIVDQLTHGMWTLQEQNIFLTSNKDILLVEGITDVSYLKAALKVFKDKGEFTNFDFDYLPCNGASNFIHFNNKFTPKKNQTLIAIWDYDKAGKDAQEEVFKNKRDRGKQITYKNFGRARKLDNIWYTFYPKIKGINNFNVEDYFPKKCIKRYVMSGKSINDICGKAKVKDLLSKDCDEGKLDEKYFNRFSVVFTLFSDILQAEKVGKTKI